MLDARRISSAVPYQLGLRLLGCFVHVDMVRNDCPAMWCGNGGVGWGCGRLAPSSAVAGARGGAVVAATSGVSRFLPCRHGTEGVGLACGRLAPSSAVFSARAGRRERFRRDKFESHSLRSLTLSGGSGIRTHVVTGTNALAGRRF